MDLRVARFADLDAATLYAILRLRAEVFVVEQECAYLDPDGRDAEPATRHLWIEAGEARGRSVVAALRLLDEGGGVHRIGRVVTTPAARGQGLAARLTGRALELCEGPVVLDAQERLVPFYEGFDFAVDGPMFVEDGIAHVPMRRAAP